MTIISEINESHNQDESLVYSLKQVSKTYKLGSNNVNALKKVSLDIKKGDFVSLEGPSGSGKSTLLQLLGALDSPTEGSIKFNESYLDKATSNVLTDIRARKLGFIFQQFNLIPTLNAIENVMIAMVPIKSTKQFRLKRAQELLEKVGLGERMNHLPSKLSGGEQQRVAIARALANSPEVLIGDEPTGNLDSETSAQVMELLGNLQKENSEVTIILATHNPEVSEYANTKIKLRSGQLAS